MSHFPGQSSFTRHTLAASTERAERREGQYLGDRAGGGWHEPRRLLTVAELMGAEDADMEDVFAVDDYLDLFNAAFDEGLREAHLPPGDRIVERIAAKLGSDFDREAPADYLLRHRHEVLGRLAAKTLDRFERLMVGINLVSWRSPSSV